MSAIVDRVRKLIALAGSPNEHESRSAAAMACRLIREHDLHLVDPSGHARRADRPAEPARRRTRGPYTRTRSARGAPQCRECAETISDDDAFHDADGAPVHGDCIPRTERP
jgi:hypothetical protein